MHLKESSEIEVGVSVKILISISQQTKSLSPTILF